MVSSDRYLKAAVDAVKVSLTMDIRRREAMQRLAGHHLANAVRTWGGNPTPAAAQ